MEARNRFPSAETIDKIAEALGIGPALLFDETASPENIKSAFQKAYAHTLQDALTERVTQAIADVCKLV